MAIYWAHHEEGARQITTAECQLTWTPGERRKRGRPKTAWKRTVEKERGRAGWRSWNDVRTAAADREGGRQNIEFLCATWHEGESEGK